MRYHTLEFQGGQLRFSAGHFTIFSATKRERLHGHNYTVAASMTAAINEPGITFDYSLFRKKLEEICASLHSLFLLPTQSPYLKIEENADSYLATFDGKVLHFLKEDALLLPLSNITLEELSYWFVEQLAQEEKFLQSHNIISFEIRVFNGPDHCAKAGWEKSS